MERIVREEGGTPATIALMSGHVKVGLTESELEEIADPKCGAVKVSARDMPNALAKVINACQVGNFFILEFNWRNHGRCDNKNLLNC